LKKLTKAHVRARTVRIDSMAPKRRKMSASSASVTLSLTLPIHSARAGALSTNTLGSLISDDEFTSASDVASDVANEVPSVGWLICGGIGPSSAGDERVISGTGRPGDDDVVSADSSLRVSMHDIADDVDVGENDAPGDVDGAMTEPALCRR
jgi:hypothetical protein